MTLLPAPSAAMTALPRDYDSDPERFLPDAREPHDDVHPDVAARLAAAGPQSRSS